MIDSPVKVNPFIPLMEDMEKEAPQVAPNKQAFGFKIPADRDEGHPSMYALGVVVTVLSAGAYIAPFFITFPFAAATQIVALGVLTAVSYGIINDQIACRQCIHYFTVGHTSIHKRLLKTDDPTLNGIVWGIHATWGLGLIAGVGMALAARATKMAALSALHLTPIAILLVIGACTYAHIKSKQEERYWADPKRKQRLDRYFRRIIPADPGYHEVELRRVPEEARVAYMGVGARNAAGYTIMPCAAIAIMIGSLAVRTLL